MEREVREEGSTTSLTYLYLYLGRRRHEFEKVTKGWVPFWVWECHQTDRHASGQRTPERLRQRMTEEEQVRRDLRDRWTDKEYGDRTKEKSSKRRAVQERVYRRTGWRSGRVVLEKAGTIDLGSVGSLHKKSTSIRGGRSSYDSPLFGDLLINNLFTCLLVNCYPFWKYK